MTEREKEIVRAAMYVLENASCGGVGAEGFTKKEIDAVHCDGHCLENDAYLDTCQTAWRILEAISIEEKKRGDATLQENLEMLEL